MIRVVEVIDEEKGVQECGKDGVPRSIQAEATDANVG